MNACYSDGTSEFMMDAKVSSIVSTLYYVGIHCLRNQTLYIRFRITENGLKLIDNEQKSRRFVQNQNF